MKYLKTFEVNGYSRIVASNLEEYLRKVGFRNPSVRPTFNEDFYIAVHPGNAKKENPLLDRITKISFLQNREIENNVIFFLLKNEDFEKFVKILTSDNIPKEIEYQENIRKYNL